VRKTLWTEVRTQSRSGIITKW